MKLIGKERALRIAQKLRNEFIYNMAKLEGNTLSYAEAETVIMGTSVAGKKMSELHQIEHIRDAWDELLEQIKTDTFVLSKYNFCHINYIVSEGENEDSRGGFRRDNVAISGTEYLPPMPIELNACFEEMQDTIKDESIPDKALDVFMISSKNQFFGDGNKRTAQLMMNGLLIGAGYAPITISPKDEVEYREHLIHYYETDEKKDFKIFLLKQQTKVLQRFRLGDDSPQVLVGQTKPVPERSKHP